jgi:hypothetical protein
MMTYSLIRLFVRLLLVIPAKFKENVMLKLNKKKLKNLSKDKKQLDNAQTPAVAGGVTTSRAWCVTTGLCSDTQYC